MQEVDELVRTEQSLVDKLEIQKAGIFDAQRREYAARIIQRRFRAHRRSKKERVEGSGEKQKMGRKIVKKLADKGLEKRAVSKAVGNIKLKKR